MDFLFEEVLLFVSKDIIKLLYRQLDEKWTIIEKYKAECKYTYIVCEIYLCHYADV